jgi:hypothetical protein
MSQLPLFDPAASKIAATGTIRTDPDSERLLAAFGDARLAQGASAQSVRREVSQLRAIIREAGTEAQPAPLRALFADLDLIACALREPRGPIALDGPHAAPRDPAVHHHHRDEAGAKSHR